MLKDIVPELPSEREGADAGFCILPNTETHATCPDCGRYAERGRAGRSRCKECHNKENRERVRRWSAANFERHRARAKEWKTANPEHAKATAQRWREQNREYYNQRQNEWRTRNPECKANAKAARRLRKSAAYKESLPRNWRREQLARQKNKCVGCGCRFSKKLNPTVDHIIPLALGGFHEPSNCQLLCFPCNARKQDLSEQEFQRRYFGRLL